MKPESISEQNITALQDSIYINRLFVKYPSIGFSMLGVISACGYSLITYGISGNYVYSCGFGFVGLVLGIYVIMESKIVNRNIRFPSITPIIFSVLGFGFSCLIHLRYETPYRLSDLRYYEVFVPVAVACFVYIFWVSFFSINKMRAFWTWLTLLLLPIFAYAFVFSYTTEDNILLRIILDPTVVVVNYCAAALFIFCTISLFTRDYFKNLILHIVIFGLVLTVITNISLVFVYLQGISESEKNGMILMLSFLLLILCANVFNIFNLVKNKKNGSNKLKRRISVTFEWIFILPALVANYSIYLAVLALIPYKGVSSKLSSYVSNENEVPIDNISLRKAFLLSVGAFFTYFVFFVVHEATEKTIYWWCVEWMLGSLVASLTLSKCLYENSK